MIINLISFITEKEDTAALNDVCIEKNFVSINKYC